MKHSITLFVFIFSFLSLSLRAQCIANAGPDQVGCSTISGFDSLQLGGNPTAIGIGPFTYAWSAHFYIGSTFHLYASDFLDDTTSAHPKLITEVEHQVFYLTVTDGMGATCTDSVLINYSFFGFHLGGCKTYFIDEGDSVFCSGWMNPIGSLPPFTYLWKPTIGLRDSTSETFWAKPDSSISYRVTVTDSAGCSATGPDVYCILVNRMNVDERPSSKNFVSVYPNPAKDEIHFALENNSRQPQTILLRDVSGRVIYQAPYTENQVVVNSTAIPNGMYLYTLLFADEKPIQGKIIVQH